MSQYEYFECRSCGTIIRLDMMKYAKFTYPSYCFEEQGGCGRNNAEFNHLNRDWVLNHKDELHMVYKE